jgi:hypothetical protein
VIQIKKKKKKKKKEKGQIWYSNTKTQNHGSGLGVFQYFGPREIKKDNPPTHSIQLKPSIKLFICPNQNNRKR